MMSSDPNEGVLKGLGRGVKSLVANTTLAISSSYASMSGSIYLGLKNAANAGRTPWGRFQLGMAPFEQELI